jgi:CheY-like chemotaxis protein
MVDLMSGNIYFESDPTVKPGTTCIVELPLPICDDDQALLPDHQNDAAFNVNDNNKNDPGMKQDLSTAPFVEPLSILIVDDIPMNRAILKKRIQKCIAPNATVQEASTGEQALMICCGTDEGSDAEYHRHDSRHQAFDIIVVDQFMEESGGVLVGTDVVIALRRSKLDCVIIGNSG